MGEPRILAGRYEVREARRVGEREELRARDRTLGREVLLVRSRFDALAERAAAERALREARALAALKHAGIQRLFDVFEEREGPVLVLEPVPGETLAARLERDGKLTPDEVRRLASELAEALAAVHAAGAVHRDVSAENIVLRTDGSACLTGFRLAKPVGLGTGTTIQYARAPGDTAGGAGPELPAHPAPEQFAGESASARSDLFALGCVLHRALTGQPAFAAPERGWSPPADARRLVPEVPRELAALVLACLARSPVGRPQSAAELAQTLKAGAPAASPRRARRAPLFGALGVALVLLLAWRLWPRAPEAGRERGLALSATAAPGASHAPGFAHSRALLIGIGTAYEGSGWKPLPNAAGDVTALAQALAERSGDQWEVRTLLDAEATHDGIRTELARLEEGLTGEDRVLIYFAGHGEPHPRSEDSGWLIPSDARRDDAGRTRWVYFDDLARAMKDSPAKHVLLALDCCYGGRVAEQRGAGALAYRETFTTEPARVVLAAGRANQPVEDGTGAHSTFAEVLLDALSDPHASYTSSELHARLQGAFLEKGLPQQPVLAHLPGVPAGEFVFLGR